MDANPIGKANIKAEAATRVRTSSIIFIPDASWQPHLAQFWMQFHLVRPQYALFRESNATRYLMEPKYFHRQTEKKTQSPNGNYQRGIRLHSR
jgi:hypothetical protein